MHNYSSWKFDDIFLIKIWSENYFRYYVRLHNVICDSIHCIVCKTDNQEQCSLGEAYYHDLGVVTMDGVWIDEWIYWPLIHTTRNDK
jgi:hypothetical protein